MDHFPIGSIIFAVDQKDDIIMETAELVTDKNQTALSNFSFLISLLENDKLRVYEFVNEDTQVTSDDVLLFRGGFDPKRLWWVCFERDGLMDVFANAITPNQNQIRSEVLNWMLEADIVSLYRQKV